MRAGCRPSRRSARRSVGSCATAPRGGRSRCSSKGGTWLSSSNVFKPCNLTPVCGQAMCRSVRRERQSQLGMAEAAQALAFPELVLGRYRPLKPLGSGGSGSVWLARDEQTQLDVALKIVAREGKAALRAEREAEAAARLRHPACLRTYGLAHDSRHVYIAYEFVPGQTFREAMRARELDDDSAIEACAQVCDGLAHAHAAGILHRDVKPSNVLLAEGPQVSARVLDFGLALMDDAETLTEQGDVPGHARVHLPRTARGQAVDGRRRRLGRRRDALGGACADGIRSGAARCSRRRARSSSARGRSAR